MLNRDELTLVTAKRLKALREEKRLSHKNLSDELRAKYNISISKSSLINYEAEDYHSKSGANSGMRIDYLRCLADYYGVTTDYLLGLSDCPSVELEVQAVCKYTGLTEQAIRAMKNYAEDDGLEPIVINRMEMLNRLLERYGMRDFLFRFCMLRRRVESISDILVEYEKSGIATMDDLFRLKSFQREIDYELYSQSAVLREMSDDLFSTEKVMRKCSDLFEAHKEMVFSKEVSESSDND